jgi:pimeloyl-ACP methyl ester carboxylesterase
MSRITVGDAELDVLTVGEGPTLVFMHGEDGLQWSRPIVDALSSSFRVLAPAAPPWDDSKRPEHIETTRDLALVYAEFLESIEGPVVIVGCSFGGWLATELAVLRPVNLVGLILVAPTGVKLSDREHRDFVDIWSANFEDIPGILYSSAGAAPDISDLPDEEYLSLSRAEEAAARYCWKPYMYDPILVRLLRRIGVPTLMVHGDQDHFITFSDYYERYAALIGESGAQVRVIVGAGHRVEEESPQELAAVVIEFAGLVLGVSLSASATTRER